jgi:peptidoglycan-N-acetylglucosamine deacetylase
MLLPWFSMIRQLAHLLVRHAKLLVACSLVLGCARQPALEQPIGSLSSAAATPDALDLPVSVDARLLPDPAPILRPNPDADLERAWLLAEGPARPATEARRLVTLTFDDGPGPRTTNAVLRVMRAHHATGTFFMLPSYFEGPSKRAAKIRQAAANIAAEGHLIGNHTMHHRKLLGLGKAITRSEIEQASTLIEQVTGKRPSVFRPPFGELDADAQDVLRDARLELTMWTVEAHDMTRSDPDRMLRDLLAQLDYSRGGIVLLHDVKWSTVKVLDRLLTFLDHAKYDAAHPERPFYELVDLPTYMRATAENPQPYATRSAMNLARSAAAAADARAMPAPPAIQTKALIRKASIHR